MEKDDRFELVAKGDRKGGGIRNMCDVIDRYLREGEEKGEANAICALYESGMKPEEIAFRLKKDLAYIQTMIQRYSVA